MPILYDPTDVVYDLTLPVFAKRTQRLQFSINGLKSANSYCKIVNYELIESKNRPDTRKLSRPFTEPKDVYMFQNCTSPPCTVVEFSQNYAVVHKFWILVTAEGGAEYILPQFRREIKATDPSIVKANLQRLKDYIDGSLDASKRSGLVDKLKILKTENQKNADLVEDIDESINKVK